MDTWNFDSNLASYDASVFQPAVTAATTTTTTNTDDMMMLPEGTNTRMLQTSRQPETMTNPIYIPAFLQQNIGKWIRLEMLIGNTLVNRVGRLETVGASFLVIRSPQSNASMLCDMYSIKFVTIIDSQNTNDLTMF